MPYAGWFVLDGTEIANSARVIAHMGADTPVSDSIIFGTPGDCSLRPLPTDSGLAPMPADSSIVTTGLASPPNGSALYDAGLAVIGPCWTASNLCGNCRPWVTYDDSWSGLQAFLGDTIYRPELAPWYSVGTPQSGEFGGVWPLSVTGLGPAPVQREVTELVGSGASAGPARDTSRVVTFTALLIACTNAGLMYGLEWLACQLRETNERTDAVLRYLAAHPGGSTAYPIQLVRELHGVVLTKSPQITNEYQGHLIPNRSSTMCQVTWELTALMPYAYTPMESYDVVWDSITLQPIQWVHATDCTAPASCDPMPTLFSAECTPAQVVVVTQPPPVCGGCLPLCEMDVYTYEIPVPSYALVCSQSAVSLTLTNNGGSDLTLQAYFQVCDSNEACQQNQYPIQVSGLPPTAQLVVDAINSRFWVYYQRQNRRPVGIVSTPGGSPWEPAILDRSMCWEFVVIAPGGSVFDVTLNIADREA